MSGLQFRFQDLNDEIASLSRFATSYLERGSELVLGQLSNSLTSFRDAPTDASIAWGIPDATPLITAVSKGAYHPSGHGSMNIFAAITSIWEIKQIRPPGKRNKRPEFFELTGTASTRVELCEATNGTTDKVAAMWRMEIGDATAPGCHFHNQILGQSDDFPFPKALDIPRLPSIIASPLAAIEFVLGELFQEDWRKELYSYSPHLHRWTSIQKHRLSVLLEWQKQTVQGAAGSPWVVLKVAKPNGNLFIA